MFADNHEPGVSGLPNKTLVMTQEVKLLQAAPWGPHP
jgi:hypothetical protein